MTPDNVYNEQEILKRLQHELPAWRHADGRLRRVYKMADWNAAIELVNHISPLAETMQHHPDIELGYGRVQVSLQTHSAGGITDKDFDLANRIEQLFSSVP